MFLSAISSEPQQRAKGIVLKITKRDIVLKAQPQETAAILIQWRAPNGSPLATLAAALVVWFLPWRWHWLLGLQVLLGCWQVWHWAHLGTALPQMIPSTAIGSAMFAWNSIGPKECACYPRDCDMESDVCVLKTGVEASSNPCGLAVPYSSMKCVEVKKGQCSLQSCETADYKEIHNSTSSIYGKLGRGRQWPLQLSSPRPQAPRKSCPFWKAEISRTQQWIEIFKAEIFKSFAKVLTDQGSILARRQAKTATISGRKNLDFAKVHVSFYCGKTYPMMWRPCDLILHRCFIYVLVFLCSRAVAGLFNMPGDIVPTVPTVFQCLPGLVPWSAFRPETGQKCPEMPGFFFLV